MQVRAAQWFGDSLGNSYPGYFLALDTNTGHNLAVSTNQDNMAWCVCCE
jgi:hypothetical protein